MAKAFWKIFRGVKSGQAFFEWEMDGSWLTDSITNATAFFLNTMALGLKHDGVFKKRGGVSLVVSILFLLPEIKTGIDA